MPVKLCRSNGKPGYKWGDKGKCYTYTPGNEASRQRARNQAQAQGAAIHAGKNRTRNFVEAVMKRLKND